MDSINGRNRFVLRFSKNTLMYFFYTILVFVLAHCVWPKYQNAEFISYQYVLFYNPSKMIFCFIIATAFILLINNTYFNSNTFSGKVILFLTMLYFIPGMAICSALNIEWSYILFFSIYFIVLLVADKIIKHPKKFPMVVREERVSIIFRIILCVCLVYPIVIMLLFDKGFSFVNVIATLNDPYGIRAQARENSMPWAFLLIETWGVYFGALMITYSLKNKKRFLAIAFIIIQLFYFSLQGNRIYLFITGVAIILGFIDAKNKYIAWAFVGVVLAQFLEYTIFIDEEFLGLVTNIYRRYSVVPNLLSPKYVDFFQRNTPDFLRGFFENISRFFGVESEYGANFGVIIGQQYFHMNMNANTGMIGGAFLEFGYGGVIIDPIMMVFSLRVFEKILMRADKAYIILVAFIYTSLAINSWSLWAQCIRISYLLLFIISLYLMFNTEKGMPGKKIKKKALL